MKNLKAEETPTDIKCEACGKLMIIKWGRRGKFLACPGYPDCKTTMDFTTGADGKVTPVEKVEEDHGECPKCKSPMLLKSGRFGRFSGLFGLPRMQDHKERQYRHKVSGRGLQRRPR